jgi:hypothetical protein
MASDCTGSNELSVTHDATARVLGSCRASIIVVAVALQRKEVIRYTRGVVTILEPQIP